MRWLKSSAHLQQNIHTNTARYIATHPGTDISLCPSPSLPGADSCRFAPNGSAQAADERFPLNVFQRLENRHIFPSCILPRDTSVCSEIAFSRSQNTPNSVFVCMQFLQTPQGLPGCKCFRCLSLRLRNVTSPCLATILAIRDLA